MSPQAARLAIPVIAGILFGAGLALGGMTDPARVRGFLDIFGRWDPTLGFVMAGAVGVMALAWTAKGRLYRPAFAERFFLPDSGRVDARLLGGATLFGIGWGLAGLCPGPAVAGLALRPVGILPFIAAMVAGMAAHRLLLERR